jgi:hypothetical protein
MTTNEIAQLRRSAEVQPANMTAPLPTVMESLMAGLKEAVTDMKADDISVELSASQDGHRSNARFTLRAYRRGQKVIDEESNV